jgi:hypothetical protein
VGCHGVRRVLTGSLGVLQGYLTKNVRACACVRASACAWVRVVACVFVRARVSRGLSFCARARVSECACVRACVRVAASVVGFVSVCAVCVRTGLCVV